MEHKRRVERKHEEKELTAKTERMRKAREAAQKARKVMPFVAHSCDFAVHRTVLYNVMEAYEHILLTILILALFLCEICKAGQNCSILHWTFLTAKF